VLSQGNHAMLAMHHAAVNTDCAGLQVRFCFIWYFMAVDLVSGRKGKMQQLNEFHKQLPQKILNIGYRSFKVIYVCMYAVWVKKIPPLKFSDIFPKRLGIFSPNFTRLLHVPIYAGLHIFIQLPATLTKLCHIKRDHHMCSKCSPSTAWNTLETAI